MPVGGPWQLWRAQVVAERINREAPRDRHSLSTAIRLLLANPHHPHPSMTVREARGRARAKMGEDSLIATTPDGWRIYFDLITSAPPAMNVRFLRVLAIIRVVDEG